jgi:hypothetical protein
VCDWCGGLEIAQHLFLSFPVFASLWGLVWSWIVVSSVDPVLLQDHFLQFIHSVGGVRARRSFMQLVWLCCISIMWTEGNNRVFKATIATIQQMLDKVKLHLLWWLKTHHVTLGINTHTWWSSPFICLGIDWLLQCIVTKCKLSRSFLPHLVLARAICWF